MGWSMYKIYAFVVRYDLEIVPRLNITGAVQMAVEATELRSRTSPSS